MLRYYTRRKPFSYPEAKLIYKSVYSSSVVVVVARVIALLTLAQFRAADGARQSGAPLIRAEL